MSPRSAASTSVHGRRVAALRKAMAREGVDAALIHSPVNVRYFSGFKSSYCFLAIGAKAAYLLTDGRYIEAASAVKGFTACEQKQGGPPTELGESFKKLKVSTLAFEPRIHYRTYDTLADIAGEKIELVEVEGLLDNPRVLKSADEVKLIERSQRLNEKIFSETISALAEAGPGACTERELAGVLKVMMIKYGVEPSFEPIVAHGANGSLPHHHPGETVVGKGPTLIDMGVVLDGYCSDMTRMICFGKPTARLARAHEAVRAAKNRAIAAVKPGAKAARVHAAAVRELEKAKLAKRFTHGLGHGVGLEIHEAPRLGANSADVLAAGHVVTVEPGVYVPGWGGIRIEDIVVVTRTGRRNLTKLSDELLVI